MTHLGSEPCLEDGTILGGPFLGNSGMVCPQLNEISKDRNTGDLGDALDLGNVGRVQQLDQHVQEDDAGEVENLGRHVGQLQVECLWAEEPDIP